MTGAAECRALGNRYTVGKTGGWKRSASLNTLSIQLERWHKRHERIKDQVGVVCTERDITLVELEKKGGREKD